jgi:hypothetical protein
VHHEPDLAVVRDCLRRIRSRLAVFTAGCAGGAVLLWVAALSRVHPSDPLLGLGAAAVLGALLGIAFLVRYARIESVPFYRQLRDAPHRIERAWVVETEQRLNGIRLPSFHSVCIRTDEGRAVRLALVPLGEVAAVLQAVRSRAPAADLDLQV